MRTLSAMFSWAVRRELLAQNLATRIQKYRDQQRERALTDDEATRLWTMIGEAEKAWVITKDFADIFRVIMLTGAHRDRGAPLVRGRIRALAPCSAAVTDENGRL